MATMETIKKLRDLTQAGIMDAKKALEENGDDIEKATQWLREKGIAKASKKAGAIATEGVVKVVINDNMAMLLEINCQTDFVSMSDAFIQLTNEITLTIFNQKPNSVEEANKSKTNSGLTVEQSCQDLTAKIGEKVAIRRFIFIQKNTNQKFASYVHNNKKIGVILVMNDSANENVGKDVAMHAAAMNPKFLNASEVDQIWLEKEKKILTEQANTDPKILAMKEKMSTDKFAIQWQNILNGKVKKMLAEVCLEDQVFVKDQTKTVSQYLKSNNSIISKYVRYEVGEGVEKKAVDFATEVAQQMNQNNG